MRLDLHLDHFQCPPEYSTEYVGVPQLVLGAAIVGQFDEVSKRIFLEHE